MSSEDNNHDADTGAPDSVLTSSSSQSNNGNAWVNEGILCWNRIRADWTAKPPGWRRPPHKKKITLDPDDYDEILNPRRPFSPPVPLPEMVRVLMEIWEADGVFD